MSIFHDEEDGPQEPIKGLPAALPPGEALIWQGRPDPMALAVHAFHIRFVAAYFVVFALGRAAFLTSNGAGSGTAISAAAGTLTIGVAAVVILSVIAWAMSRKAVFTLTDRRVFIRHGVAIPKYIDLPFSGLSEVGLRGHADGKGDIALTTNSDKPVPYLHLWPFARPLKYGRTIPLLRALPNAAKVATKIVTAMKENSPATVTLGSAIREEHAEEHSQTPMPMAREATAS